MFQVKNLLAALCVLVAFGISAEAAAKDNNEKSKIPDGSVTTEKIADGAVTGDKLSADVAARLDEIDALKQQIAALEQLVDNQHQAMEAMQAMLGCIHPDSNSLDLVFDSCNVHVRNGDAVSQTANSLGNLIIGYNENSGLAGRNGSHNLVIGPEHDYDGSNGIVAGTASAMLEVGGGQAKLGADEIAIASENDLTVDSRLGNILLDSEQGRLDASAGQSMALEVNNTSVRLKNGMLTAAGTEIVADANGPLRLKGTTIEAKALGNLALEGANTVINGGGNPAARVGDTVSGTVATSVGIFPFIGSIDYPGSTSLLIP